MTAINRPNHSAFRKLMNYLKGHWELYLFVIPGLTVVFLFKLLPMQNIIIAFKNFKPLKGIENSPWAGPDGLNQFRKLFSDPEVWNVIKNTVEINLLLIVCCMPLPMLSAILLNEMNCTPVKKTVQTVVYLPHFFTWVVVYGIFFSLFSSTGLMFKAIKAITGQEVLFFIRGGWFRFLLILSYAWKGTGWGTIHYLAAISAIDSEIFEAARIDGAGRLQQIRYITMPCLVPTFILLLTIRLGSILSGGFDQVLAFYNSTVYKSADILGTFVYRQGIGQANFSYATAVGLFESVVGFVFVLMSNVASKRLTGHNVW